MELSAKTDIVEVARGLRAEVGPGNVSPNHILIPAAWGHSCPSGPPSPVPNAPRLPRPARPYQPVTVIDSGYQWDPNWGDNPLETMGRGAIPEQEAEYLDQAGNWQPGIPDELDVDRDDLLDALAGHANFIAGVIAQHCPHAQITIWNHNGGFHPSSDDFPTEAAVARSLVMSQRQTPAKVIDLGFAFKALDDDISAVWEVAFESIGPDPVVVAPAGNQSPAARSTPRRCNYTFPGNFPNVIGVASFHPGAGGGPVPSTFTNRGDWVTSAAQGENVVSTFLHVDMPVEDDPAPYPTAKDFTPNAWASWNGTSFAAPKVVAAIADEIALTGAVPIDAWQALQARWAAHPDLGVVLP